MTAQRAVIIGASHAGAQLAASLRQERWTGEIVLIGDESALPYQRPPLSQAYLASKSTLKDLELRRAEFYSTHGITLLDATVEPKAHPPGQLSLHTGNAVPFDTPHKY